MSKDKTIFEYDLSKSKDENHTIIHNELEEYPYTFMYEDSLKTYEHKIRKEILSDIIRSTELLIKSYERHYHHYWKNSTNDNYYGDMAPQKQLQLERAKDALKLLQAIEKDEFFPRIQP